MNKFAVIGNPIEHSLSPSLHNRIFRELAIDAEYQKIHCDSDDLPGIAAQLKNGNLSGINVTLPYKHAIMEYLDQVHPDAQKMGAVNCVVHSDKILTGYNTDWSGFLKLLKRNTVEIKNRTFVVLGAGGVARSVLYTLLVEAAGTVIIINRTPANAERLISDMTGINSFTQILFMSLSAAAPYLKKDITIINCTSLGMYPDIEHSPLPVEIMHAGQTLIDTIYTPVNTQFLKFGQQSGAKTIDGLGMFIYQAVASQELWFGKDSSVVLNTGDLREFLINILGK